jgi:ribose transport system substrate-binding protein
MTKPRFLISLITKENDYQREQASAAESVARELGVEVEVIYANSDPITQSQQLLGILQSAKKEDYKGFIVEPAGGTCLTQVARTAVQENIGWVLLNREIETIDELRRVGKVPVFSLSSDNEEVGHIQGRQMGALLPSGGTVLYLQGPSASQATQRRTHGMLATKPKNVNIKTLRCTTWTEEGGHQAVASWVRLTVANKERIDLAVGQNDLIAYGARRALQENNTDADGGRWSGVRYVGVDGSPQTGQAWVKSGTLVATVVLPPNTVPALRMLSQASKDGNQPAASTFVTPYSFPEITQLHKA